MVKIFFMLVTINHKTLILRFHVRFTAETMRMEATSPVSHGEQSGAEPWSVPFHHFHSFTRYPLLAE